MTLAISLQSFNTDVAQCESLIANAHKTDAAGAPILPQVDREQITVAAFLNMYIAWESFLESSLSKLMTGEATIGGNAPVRYVSPATTDAAKKIVIGVMRYFDYANLQSMRKVVSMYFDAGYPYEPHLGAMQSDLDDMRAMRNASAHITSTTQQGIGALAMRILGQPQPNISLYRLLTTIDPRSAAQDTVFVTYKDKLLAAASLIANG